MANKKNDLESMLTPIKKGQALRLSTTTSEDDAISHERTNALSHKSDIALSHQGVKRVNRGYKLREDLIIACKRLALDQNRNLYEVMEDALSEYVERHKESQT